MKRQINAKEIIIISGIILSICFCLFFLFRPHFYVKNYQEEIEVNYKGTFFDEMEACYGTYFKCNQANLKQDGIVDSSVLGDYPIEVVVSYKDKSLHLNQMIRVVDKESPVLTVNGEEFKYCPNGKLDKYDVKAIDNYDGDISDKVEVNVVNDKLVFEVKDSFDNYSKVEKDAKKVDDKNPEISLKGDNVIYVKKGSTYKELGASASDNCDGDLTNDIVVDGSVNSNKVGDYKLVYKVKDSSGLESEVSRTVKVYEDVQVNTNTNTNSNIGNGKVIYLTFDDGPSKQTGRLLDVLKKYNVKATFFVTNQRLTVGYDDMIRRAYQEGHTIGLHSDSHVYKQIYTSVDNYMADLYAIQKKVQRITGYTSMYVRFPGGSSNTVSKNYDGGTHIMTTLANTLTNKGFKYYDWNVSSGDAGETTNTSVVARNVIKSLGTKSAYMVLQHDIYGYSVDAVETIIQYGLSHGYTFKNIDSQTPTIHHSINN